MKCKDYNVELCPVCKMDEPFTYLSVSGDEVELCCWMLSFDDYWPSKWPDNNIKFVGGSRKEWFISWHKSLNENYSYEDQYLQECRKYLSFLVKLKYPELEKLLILL